MGRTYLFLSGKGGTWKTTLSTSLGIALARKGKRTVLVDADIGLRCADQLLGMEIDILDDRLVFLSEFTGDSPWADHTGQSWNYADRIRQYTAKEKQI